MAVEAGLGHSPPWPPVAARCGLALVLTSTSSTAHPGATAAGASSLLGLVPSPSSCKLGCSGSWDPSQAAVHHPLGQTVDQPVNVGATCLLQESRDLSNKGRRVQLFLEETPSPDGYLEAFLTTDAISSPSEKSRI